MCLLTVLVLDDAPFERNYMHKASNPYAGMRILETGNNDICASTKLSRAAIGLSVLNAPIA